MRSLIAGAATLALLVGLGGCVTPLVPSAPVAAPKASATEPTEAPTLDIAKLDRIPVLKHSVAPKYPTELKRQGVEGFAEVVFVVTTQGTTRFAYPILTSNPAFGFNTVAALKKWTFTPGSKGGRAVNTHMAVPLAFTLHPHGPWTEVLNRLSLVFYPISNTWAHIHNVTAPADMAALPFRNPLVSIRIVADANGGLVCDPAGTTGNPPPPELILFINQALAAHPIAPDTVDLVRATSGFYLQMPVFPARPPLTQAPPTLDPVPAGAVDVWLIPMEGISGEDVGYVRKRLIRETGLTVRAKVTGGQSPRMFDGASGQIIAERIIQDYADLSRRLDATTARTAFVVLTPHDMNQQSGGLRYVFMFTDPVQRLAVVSIARMRDAFYGEPEIAGRAQTRLYKMVKKTVGLLYYGYDRSTDRRTVMYSPVLGLADLDAIGTEYQ